MKCGHYLALFLMLVLFQYISSSTPIKKTGGFISVHKDKHNKAQLNKIIPKKQNVKTEKNLGIKLNTNSAGTCTSGFGFSGKCFTDANTIKNIIPNDFIANTWNKDITKLFKRLTNPPNTCMGDYTGLEAINKLKQFKCEIIPWAHKENLGFLGAYSANIPCGKSTTLELCLGFDKCGTFGIAMNGDSTKCFTNSKGVGGIISQAGDFLKQAAFSFSFHKKLQRQIEISTIAGDQFHTKKILVSGHFYVELGLDLPSSYLKNILINGKGGDEFFSVKRTASILIDMGSTAETTADLIDNIRLGSQNSKHLLNKIMISGREITLQAAESISFKLSKITDGFLPDLSLKIKEISILITLGRGQSNLPPGFYLKSHSDNIKNCLEEIRNIIKYFKHLLDSIGFKLPEITSLSGVSFGLTVNNLHVGFEFDAFFGKIKCLYIFENKKTSCQFGSNFFMAVQLGGKWVVKNSKSFFDETGDVLGKVRIGADEFALALLKTKFKDVNKTQNHVDKFNKMLKTGKKSMKIKKRKI